MYLLYLAVILLLLLNSTTALIWQRSPVRAPPYETTKQFFTTRRGGMLPLPLPMSKAMTSNYFKIAKRPTQTSNKMRRQWISQKKITTANLPKFFNFKPSKFQGDAPGAYSWGYSWVDQFGTQMFREETADGRGSVWGRYSIRDANGLLRIVEYVADPTHGFRTRIRSNEPGIVSSKPANVEYIRFDDENNIPD